MVGLYVAMAMDTHTSIVDQRSFSPHPFRNVLTYDELFSYDEEIIKQIMLDKFIFYKVEVEVTRRILLA